MSLTLSHESVRIVRSGFGLQRVVSTEAAVGGIVLDGEEKDKEESLCLSGNRISNDIFYAYLDYRPFSGSDNVVEETNMQVARSDAWVATVLIWLEQ